MDWIRLTRMNPNLSGVGGKILDITPDELGKHNKREDAWICLKGRVYNVTPYMEFHPGGEDELMRGIGKDATDLFNQVHKWVNFESMLEKCLVGKLVAPTISLRKSSFAVPKIQFFKKLHRSDTTASEDVPDLGVDFPGKPFMGYEWSQDDSTITITIQCGNDYALEEDRVVADLVGQRLRIRIGVEKFLYFIHAELQDTVYNDYYVHVNCKLKSVEVRLVKEKSGISWSSLGTFLPGHNQTVPSKAADVFSRPCVLIDKCSVTHDVYIFTFALPQGSFMWLPIGHHVSLECNVKGMKISRSYTPVIPRLDRDQATSDGKCIHLMIKVYSDGVLTPVLNDLSIGETVEMKDAEGDFDASVLSRIRNLVLLAAGTGFTPMVRLLHWALFVSKDVNVKLMAFNKTVKDIIWKDQLDALEDSNDRLSIVNVLSGADDSWEGPRGRICIDLLQGFIPDDDPGDSLLVCVCGPLPFTKTALKCLEDLEYSQNNVHAFLG
uniref:Cytochrome b5 reductase 4 n=1 Tax=Ornithodoros turicata TaxID=34597 RepID=A0A2R5LCN6_9ACAR